MKENQNSAECHRAGRSPSKNTSTNCSTNFPPCVELDQVYLAMVRRAARASEHNILRLPAVVKKTGRASSTIWRDVKAGTFVPPIYIGERSVGWLQHEVDAVLQAWVYASRSGTAVDIKNFVKALTATRRTLDALIALDGGERYDVTKLPEFSQK